ncbi:CGNR zinc finger domain-containing protein [Nocardiopsis tropica]|uniref:ABATE domain-containing protein n=1 Tax=Nocardiopsis tropica TaxID=109330 RepID=A0ABU7L1P9_9ACTN|nr:ABATE domain-containing protein [Nocardiopsis umidischolae]MEE2055487.1 ABATE domain-containing protein [Nocardiopsis umidischolae]
MGVSVRVQDMPVRGEHPALDLVNTVFVRGGLRGRLVDALSSPEELDAWIAEHADSLGPLDPDLLAGEAGAASALARFLDLRDSLRRLVTAAARAERADPEDVRAVNSAARAHTDRSELPPSGHGPALHRTDAPDTRSAVWARVARAAVDLLTGPDLELLHACQAPGCVLFYLRTHPRREWCSPGCGTRVRVARHSKRRADGPGGAVR